MKNNMRAIWQKIKRHRLIIIILGVAFLIRLINLFAVGDFAWDEMFSFTFARLGWGESLGLWFAETNPPLHLLFLKIWFLIFPDNEFFARLPGLFFGLATIWLVYLIGRKYFQESIGLIAATALAFMPYHIFLTGFARGYSLLLCLATATIYFFLKIITQEKPAQKDLYFLSLINLSAIFTHLTAVLIILAQFIILLKKGPLLKKWFIAHLPTAFVAAIWIVPSFYYKLQNPADFGTAWFFNFAPRPQEIFIPLKLLFFGPVNSGYAIALMLIFISGLGWEIIRQTRRQPEPIFQILLAFFFVPLLNALALNLWNIKFFIIALPATVLLFARLITHPIKNTCWAIIIIALIALPGLIHYARLLPLSDWTKLNQTVIQNTAPGHTAIFVSTNFVDQLLLNRYYTAPTAVQVYFPSDRALNKQDFVTKNYLHYPRTDEELAAWLNANNFEEYDTLFLLQEDAFGVDLADYLTQKTNWRQTQELPARLADPRRLLLYEKN